MKIWRTSIDCQFLQKNEKKLTDNLWKTTVAKNQFFIGLMSFWLFFDFADPTNHWSSNQMDFDFEMILINYNQHHKIF